MQNVVIVSLSHNCDTYRCLYNYRICWQKGKSPW